MIKYYLKALAFVVVATLSFSCEDAIENEQNELETFLKNYNLERVDVQNLENTENFAKFSSIEEARKYLDSFERNVNNKSLEINLERTIIKEPRGEHLWGELPEPDPRIVDIIDITIWYGVSGYTVSFAVTDNRGVISIDQMNSNLAGVHPGVSWTQQIATHSVDGRLVNFQYKGTQTYYIFVEGIGTVATQNVRLTGWYNTQTGAYEMTAR